ncbi:MAG: hypothetical protein KY455_04855 [Euryarchaeota archaeon]|nr:hypothetical protein [Euryarchaeota archaeon]
MRLIGVFVVVSALVSTGVAAGFPEEAALVAGHSAYLRAVIEPSAAGMPLPPPVDYGLSTQRETYLFGAFASSRALDERDGRMVFAWNSDHPDPRISPSLVPSGDFAQVRDRYGVLWTVYEFQYLGVGTFGAPTSHFAYGVRVGEIHDIDPHQPAPAGIEGSYNWAITYRLDRLFPDRFEATPEGIVAKPTPAVPAVSPPPVAGALLEPVQTGADPVVREMGADAMRDPPTVVFGLNRVPALLAVDDPAKGPAKRLER